MAEESSARPVLIIDGSKFSDFDGFAREFSRLLDNHTWNGNLDAFNDILHGGFGTPPDGWILRWTHSESSRAAFGHEATALHLEKLVRSCHPSNRAAFSARLDQARRGTGPTLFDEIVEIIRDHADSGIALELR